MSYDLIASISILALEDVSESLDSREYEARPVTLIPDVEKSFPGSAWARFHDGTAEGPEPLRQRRAAGSSWNPGLGTIST